MFGYVKPYKPDMLVREYEQYKSVYCALCRQLGKEYGVLSKLILSYDCTFLAIMAKALKGGNYCFEKKRCRANPLKKCSYCTGIDEHLSMSAAFSVISFYYKIQDAISDSTGIKRVLYHILKMFAYRSHKKAAKKYSILEKIVSDMMLSQQKAEAMPESNIDVCSEPTATMLCEVMKLLAENDKQSTIYAEFGYFLGRWLYIADATDDMQKDKKKNNFNPFNNKFKDLDLNIDEKLEECNRSMNECVCRIISAYELMEIKAFKGITDNAVKLGFSQMQREILTRNGYKNNSFKKGEET